MYISPKAIIIGACSADSPDLILAFLGFLADSRGRWAPILSFSHSLFFSLSLPATKNLIRTGAVTRYYVKFSDSTPR